MKARARREPLLRRLLENVPEGESRVVQSKATRLRRELKDALIAKLILLDQTVAKRKHAENVLRNVLVTSLVAAAVLPSTGGIQWKET